MTSILLYDTTSPPLIHAVLGTGLPVALQFIVTLSPSVTGVEHRWIVTLGESGRNIKTINKNEVTLSKQGQKSSTD